MKKIFYLCDGEVPECSKTTCFKNEKDNEFQCRHTSDISHAINFKKDYPEGGFYENEKRDYEKPVG